MDVMHTDWVFPLQEMNPSSLVIFLTPTYLCSPLQSCMRARVRSQSSLQGSSHGAVSQDSCALTPRGVRWGFAFGRIQIRTQGRAGDSGNLLKRQDALRRNTAAAPLVNRLWGYAKSLSQGSEAT